MISWDTPAPPRIEEPKQILQSAMDFDWGAPVMSEEKDEGFQIKWEDEDEDQHSSDSEGMGISMKMDKSKEEEEHFEENEDEEELQEQIDIMAQQLKFVACLKIIMEELSTLATGFEVDGT